MKIARELFLRVVLIVHHRLWRAAYRSRIIAEGLARRGHDVTLLVTADTEKFRFRESTVNGVRVVESPDLTFGDLRSGWDPVAAFRRTRWLRSRGEKYDVIPLLSKTGQTFPSGY